METLDILGNRDVQMAARATDNINKLNAQIAEAIISTKSWSQMTVDQQKICINYLVSESETEVELRQRLADIGAGYVAVSWLDVDPNDKTSLEAQMLVKALGGPVAKNGALVMVMSC